MNVDSLCEDIVRREGGFTDNPHDRGGPTKYGITLKTLRRHLPNATVEDIKNLSKEVAIEIYRADYFFSPRINTLPEEVQAQLFDISVNSGPQAAIRMLQSVLNLAGYEVSVDGMLGPNTRGQCQDAVEKMGLYLVNAIEEYREHFYQQIVANDPTQQVFLAGWLKRAQEFRMPTQESP